MPTCASNEGKEAVSSSVSTLMRDIPFARRGPLDDGRFGLSFDGSVQHHLHLPEFGKQQLPCLFLIARKQSLHFRFYPASFRIDEGD
jgi:hypothetical protein